MLIWKLLKISSMKKAITTVKALRSGYSAVQTVKSGIDAICHPIQWAKDQLIGAIKNVLLTQLKKQLGEAAAHAIINRLDIEGKTYPLTLNIPITKPLRKTVEENFLELVESITNDALAIPLQALGYRLASVEFEYDEQRNVLTAKTHVGLLRLERTIPAQEPSVAKLV